MPGTDRKIFPEKVETPSGEQKGGLLSAIGDPIGKGLNATLSPIGAGVGYVTGPVAEGAASVSRPLTGALGIDDKGDAQAKEAERTKTVGGKEPGGDNPLGLNQ